MSRRKPNRIKKEELNKEYKDPNIIGQDIENEIEKEEDKDEIVNDVEDNEVYDTNNEYKTIVIKCNCLIKTIKSLESRTLLVKELDENEKKFFTDLPGFSMAILKPGTSIEAIDEGDGWYRLHKGYIYNNDISKNKDVEAILSKDRYLSRMDDINKLSK